MAKTAVLEKPEKAAKAAKKQDDSDRWLVKVMELIHELPSGKLDITRPAHLRLVKSSQIALERAESILYDIMAVARAGTVGVPVELTTLVPTAVIQEAIELGTANAVENGVEITFTNNAGDIPVQADPKLLKRLLDNLIYNALRHTPHGGPAADRG